MSNITTTPSHTIRAMTHDDLQNVSDTLAAAFLHDPVFAWCLPDPARRRTLLPAFFRLAALAVAPAEEATVSTDGSAAALWVPPATAAVTDPVAFGAALADLVGGDAERTFALMALLDETHPTEEHRFLWFLGARPELQGQGRGSSLLRHTLVRSDAEGVGTYLDATSAGSRRLYERHGFEVVGTHTVAGSPPVWAMWREPRLVA